MRPSRPGSTARPLLSPDAALEAHLAGCASCRAWQQRAHAVTRRARLGGAFLEHDLAPRVLAAVAFAAGAFRPRLSAGLAWPCGIAALGLAGTALTDLVRGQALGADEAMHLVAVAGAALLAWQALKPDLRSAGPALAAGPAADDLRPAAEQAGGLKLARIPPRPPGGHAAWMTGPDIAAQAADHPAAAASAVSAQDHVSRDESVA